MNGVGRLYNNEMKKMIRQTAFKVLLIILSVLVVFVPVFLNVVDIISDKLSQSDHWYESILESSGASVVEKTYYTAYKETDEFFEGEDIGEWLYNLYYYEYGEAKKTVALYDLLIAGEDKDDIKDMFYDVMTVEISENGEYVPGETIYLYDEHDYLKNLTLEEARQNRGEVLKYIDQIEKFVRANDFHGYIASTMAAIDSEIKVIKDDIAARSAAVPNLSEAYDVLAQNRADSMRIEGAEILKSAYQFVYDNNLPADSWQNKVITMIQEEATLTYSEYPDYTEEEYKALGNQYRYEFKNYEQYSRRSAENIMNCKNVFARVNYAFEHNVPLPEGLDTSVKGTWQTLISVICGFIILFMIIAAGMSVSSEYSSGSIRLLLVRPRKRWKILFSKLAGVTTYALILMVAAFIVPMVITIAFCGVGDIFVSDVVAKGGVAYEVNAIVSSLIVLAKCTVSGFMHMSFAFMLSTIVGKSDLAIALPFVAQTFASSLQTISYLIYRFWPGVKYTPLPYLDLSAFVPQENFLSSIGSMFVSGFSFEIGLAYNIIFTLLALVIAFAVFSRKEIKN